MWCIRSSRFDALPTRGLLLGCLIACLAGCSPPNLLWNGIGESAYVAGETEKDVEAAAKYFNTMCVDNAKLRFVVGPGGQKKCAEPLRDPTSPAWEAITLAALNDIQQRCGVYLSTIDQAHRNQAYYTRTLSNITSLTNTVLPLTEPGKIPLQVVEIIFGYGQSSLENYYSRLILETEKGVVERIVTNLQTAYRQKLLTKLSELRKSSTERFDGMSSAYYAARGYLRLCMPATIEAEIGSLLENVQYGEDLHQKQRVAIQKDNPLLASIDAIPTIPIKYAPPTRPDPTPTSKLPTNKELRTKLCIKVSDASLDGDAEAVAAIAEFRAAVAGDAANTSSLTEPEMRMIGASTSVCDGKPYLSVFEKFAFFLPDRIEVLNQKLLTAMRKETPNQVVNIKDKSKLGADTRQAISVLRKKFAPQDARTYVDWEFYGRIVLGGIRQ